MGLRPSNYRDQGVHGDSQSGFPDRQPERQEEQRGRDVESAATGMRSGSPVYDLLYTGLLGKEKEKSLDTYGSWDAGSQALKTSTSASTSNSKSETLMSPYGDYDMDDSSFFAHTTRLNIIGPNPNSTRFLRRRSSSTENLLINCGERSMATAASSIINRSRSRSRFPSPPVPLVPEKRTSPTGPYLRLSQESSLPLADPTASRKLLVLDLNGTLLLRSARSGRPAPSSPYSHVRYSGARTTSIPNPPRTVYPRPYLPSFRAYISHPTTLQWLDTMVWSSVQPHNVNDMVDKCFGTYKEVLKAVWARDTLGLSEDEYYKKTQTVKDLARPWRHIPSLIPNQFRPENPDSKDRDNHPSVPQRHSALTTVLLDDSAPKAILQPWNHLCVSEYGSERRKLDVKIAERERERKWLAERERERTWLAEQDGVKEVAEEEEMARDGTATDVDMAAVKSSENPTTEVENNEAERERKRKEKKLFKKEKLLLAKEQQLEVQGNGVEEEESYDELLLAVVGILDALKHEGNVAGWMRSGGLVHVVGGDQETISETPETEETLVTTTTTTTMSMPIPIPNPQTTVISSIFPLSPRSKRDSSSISIQGPSKRRRLSHSQDMGLDGERTLEMDSDSEMVVLPTTPTMITDKKSLSMSSVPSSESPLHPSPPHSSESPLLFSAQVEQALTGVPLSTAAEAAASSTTPTETSGNNMTSGSTPTPIPQTQFQHLLWHKRPCVLSYWVQRGRKALAELEIDIIHGVVPPNY